MPVSFEEVLAKHTSAWAQGDNARSQTESKEMNAAAEKNRLK